MVKVTIFDDQSLLKISKSQTRKAVKLFLEKENISTDEVIIHFVDKKIITKMHIEYFNDPTSTDCISFPIDLIKTNVHSILGEVFICTDTAVEYAKKNNIDPYDELTLYLIHGLLHLIGYDDINKKDKIIMRKKEKSSISYLKEHI